MHLIVVPNVIVAALGVAALVLILRQFFLAKRAASNQATKRLVLGLLGTAVILMIASQLLSQVARIFQ